MATDNSFLFLLPLITAVIVGIMLNKLIAVASVFLAAAIAILIGTHSVLVSIPFVLLSFFFFAWVGRLYLFEKRVGNYIVEGNHILEKYGFDTPGTIDYIVWVRTWSKKVSEDIRRHKGQAEMELFLVEATTRIFESKLADSNHTQEARMYASYIVGTQLRQLMELRNRL